MTAVSPFAAAPQPPPNLVGASRVRSRPATSIILHSQVSEMSGPPYAGAGRSFIESHSEQKGMNHPASRKRQRPEDPPQPNSFLPFSLEWDSMNDSPAPFESHSFAGLDTPNSFFRDATNGPNP